MEPWIFDGDALCADFANTLRDRYLDRPRETLTVPEHLPAWFDDAGLSPGFTECDPSDLDAARALREAIYAVLRSRPDPARIALVNRTAVEAPRHRLTPTATGLAAPTPPPVTITEALGLVAADLVRLVADGLLGQVKECSHQRCGLVYVDRSRGLRRRWCSMQRCGNRTKASLHDQRRRATSQMSAEPVAPETLPGSGQRSRR